MKWWIITILSLGLFTQLFAESNEMGITQKATVDLNHRNQLKESPGNWLGPNDLSAQIFLSYDTSALKVSAQVKDNKPLHNPRSPVINAPWWKLKYDGDAIFLTLTQDTLTVRVLLYPGMYGVSPAVYFQPDGKSGYQIIKDAKIEASYRSDVSGYSLSGEIPVTALGLKVKPLTVELELFDSDGPARTVKSMKNKPLTLNLGTFF